MSITIPDFPLPFEIPHMIHPLIVHFAIALPVILIILELINLVAKRRLLSGINLFFTLLIAFIFFAAYLTGKTDAKGANVDLEALTLHKELGIYLVYGSIALLFFKLLSFINKIQFKVLFLVTLIIFTIVSFVEGKRGGELVYKYGLNVKKSQQTNINEEKTKEPKTDEASQEKAHQEEKEVIKEPKSENKGEAKKDEKAGNSESVKEQKEESQSEANTTENKQEIEKKSAEHEANSVKNEENASKNEESAKNQVENETNSSKESNTQEKNTEHNESQSETNSSH